METENPLVTEEAIFCGHLEPVEVDKNITDEHVQPFPGKARDFCVDAAGSHVQILDQSEFSNFCQG